MIDAPRLVWTEDGAPRSGRFGDVYFSAEDGLAESRAVFLQGCGLPEAWAGRRRFVVGETGFGTGLNVLALLDLWRRDGPADGRLHVFTLEAYPLTAEEAARAHAPWPELAELSRLLTARWPRRTPGVHRIDLSELRTVVDVAHAEAAHALRTWSGRADAWFLDGFAPAAGDGLWRPEVLELIAARSAPGARLATFTVAGAVRRGLAEAGFHVDKRAGFGRKRERLEAVLPGEPAADEPAPRVAVLGGGIAGAALARAVGRAGARAVVFAPGGPGAGASGNAAALVTPRFDAGDGVVAELSAQAFHHALDLYGRETPQAVLGRGVLQLEAQARNALRFDKVAAQPLWPEGAMVRLDPAEASARLGEPTDRGGLWMVDALTVEPQAVLGELFAEAEVVEAAVARLAPGPDGWALLAEDGSELGRFDAVVVAAGPAAAALVGAPLSPVRGQATTVRGVDAPAAAWGGYVVPTRNGVLFGSTHDRGDAADDARDADDARNLAKLAEVRPSLAAALQGAPVAGRGGVRATTPDRLPLAGPVAGSPGLFVLGGLGSRGFTLAPLLAEHVVALALGLPSPLPVAAATRLDPARFVGLPPRPEPT